MEALYHVSSFFFGFEISQTLQFVNYQGNLERCEKSDKENEQIYTKQFNFAINFPQH